MTHFKFYKILKFLKSQSLHLHNKEIGYQYCRFLILYSSESNMYLQCLFCYVHMYIAL